MIYLNNNAGSFPKPSEIKKRIWEHLDEFPVNPYRSSYPIKVQNYIEETRANLARFFSMDKTDHLIFTSGATESLNLAIKGFLKQNDHVVTTCIEHNSVLRPLKTLEKEGVIQLSIVGCDSIGFVNPLEIEKLIQPNTKLIVINHASNITGTIQDISSVVQIAKKYNIAVLLDASQTAGSIPIHFNQLGVDMMAFTGHKFLFAYEGIGGLILKNGIRIKPLKTGGTGVFSTNLYQPEQLPHYYEAGTQNTIGIISLSGGVDFIRDKGIANLFETKKNILQILLNSLFELKDEIQLIGFSKDVTQLPVINFRFYRISVEDAGYILENTFKIIVRSGLHCAPLIHHFIGSEPEGTIRVSPSSFTTEYDVKQFIDALHQIAKINN